MLLDAMLAFAMTWFVPVNADPALLFEPSEIVCDAWACEGGRAGAWAACTCTHTEIQSVENSP